MLSKKHIFQIACLLCLVLFQGCLLHRLQESKRQLCDHDQIKLEIDDAIVISFEQPKLFATDIIEMLGDEPTASYEIENGLIFKYVVTRDGSGETTAYDIPLTFHFVRNGDRHLLVKAQADKNIKEVLSSHLVTQLFKSICTSERKGYAVRFDLLGVDRHLLPDIDKIVTLLGDPHGSNKARTVLTYYYTLNSSQTAEIFIKFYESTKEMTSIRLTFFHYSLDVDLVNNTATGKPRSLGSSLQIVKMGFVR